MLSAVSCLCVYIYIIMFVYVFFSQVAERGRAEELIAGQDVSHKDVEVYIFHSRES